MTVNTENIVTSFIQSLQADGKGSPATSGSRGISILYQHCLLIVCSPFFFPALHYIIEEIKPISAQQKAVLKQK